MSKITLLPIRLLSLSLFALSALRTTTVSTRVAAPLGLAGGAEPAADVEALLRSEPYIGDRMDRMQAQLRSVDAELQRTRELLDKAPLPRQPLLQQQRHSPPPPPPPPPPPIRQQLEPSSHATTAPRGAKACHPECEERGTPCPPNSLFIGQK